MLYIVGIGPGDPENLTERAYAALSESALIVGYTVYVDLVRPLFPEKEYYETPMTKERERVSYALAEAEHRTVSLICSGDSAVYGMAALALELAERMQSTAELVIVPGLTAALTGGAVLGAPLSDDFALISLSDHLTPYEVILKRLRCAAQGDFTIVLYNPSSKKRPDYLRRACEELLKWKRADTVCGYVENIGREGERSAVLSLRELCEVEVNMFTTVFIGCDKTRVIDGRMVTPRGYALA